MHRRLAALVAGTVLIVAACGDGDGSSVATPASTSSPAAGASSSAPSSTAAPDAEPDATSPTSGSASSDPASTDPPPTQPAATDPAAEVVEPLPDVSVQDVAAGTQVNLASLLPADRPILLWMWAPH